MRLLSVLAGLCEACEFPMSADARELQIPELPAWGHNICRQLRVTILKRFAELNPKTNPVNARNVGKIIGVGLREMSFMKHDLEPLLQEVDKDFHSVPSESDALLDDSESVHAIEVIMANFQRRLDNSLRLGFAQTPAEQQEFLIGLVEGQALFLDAQGQFAGDRGRTTIYFELLSLWPEIEALRQARPQKRCLDLYALLAPGLGDPHHQRYDWFFGICKEIGLSMKAPGRPRKSSK